ncbi:MAG: hypothetical protein RMJ19_12395 [Gemmatales bacterium]|nr:hypothetical protein [Gemmatales bacterium]MDW8176465.1 hypothetical protein [Gemmatales bacterium]
MPGQAKAVKSGQDLQRTVEQLAVALGLGARTNVNCGRRIWGPKRRIDVVINDGKGQRLGVECKYQATQGTAEEKILATLQDIAHWPIPGIVVIDGEGFSEDMVGYLISTGKVILFEDLEDWLRLYFGL